MMPESNIIRNSDVFTYMNDEAVKSKNERQSHTDSAFLQKNCRSSSNLIGESEVLDDILQLMKNEPNNINYLECEELPKLLQCDEVMENIHIFSKLSQEDGSEQFSPDTVNTIPIVEIVNEPNSSEKSMDDRKTIQSQIENIQNQLLNLSRLPQIIQSAIECISTQVSFLLSEDQVRCINNIDTSLGRNICITDNNEEKLYSENKNDTALNISLQIEEECKTSSVEEQLNSYILQGGNIEHNPERAQERIQVKINHQEQNC